MKTEPKIKPGDVVRYISRSKEFRPGPYKALNKTVNSWSIPLRRGGSTIGSGRRLWSAPRSQLQ